MVKNTNENRDFQKHFISGDLDVFRHEYMYIQTYASMVILMQPMEGSLCLLSAALTEIQAKKCNKIRLQSTTQRPLKQVCYMLK